MDVDDPHGNSFYDEIESLIPPPGDYNLDDIDEILRSANAVLDAPLDFNNIGVTSELYNFNFKNEFTPISEPNFDLSNYNTTTTLQNEPQNSQSRKMSILSMDSENFNPDEFMNFLNDDNNKFEELTGDSDYSNNSIEDVLQRNRNTPSPTSSCSSSDGSSTSGIQSDVSSVGSMTPAYSTQTEMTNNFVDNEAFYQTSAIVDIPVTIQTPQIPIITATPNVLQTQIVPQIAQGTVTTLKTVPVKVLGAIKPTIAAPIKIEAKFPTKQLNNEIQNVKLVNNTGTTINSATITPPPPNAKPKTIFLSSNDFKTLMQRMNSNGTKVIGNGAKINGAINAQMPKIIMKAPNGKVITTNKIVQPLTGSASKAIMSKIITANGSQLLMNQQQIQAATHSQKSDSNNSKIFKGIIDEKLFKKQQRMLKNRESASLSRKKKKEYVVSLETRINNLEKENYTLKGENKSLRSQLVAFAQTCHCKNGNVSEFILNSLNAAENKRQPVKIAPKPSGKSFKQRMTAANVRKNVAVLFAMAFMVSINMGNFQNLLNKNSLESNMAEQTAEEPLPQVPKATGGRRILWVETEAEYNEKLNRSKRDSEINMPQPPPLHFLRPVNRTVTGQPQQQQNETNATGIGMNITENQRLARNLRKWIGGNANFLNLSLHDESFGSTTYDDDLVNPTGFKASMDYYDMKSHNLPLQQSNGPGGGGAGIGRFGTQQKRKLYVTDDLTYENGKQRKLDNELDNSLDLFKPKFSEEYLRLFKGIKRQDDTFYVLSFNMDHILLPADNYNKSVRPKMALMLPAGNPALNGDITLMQIDCEVTNTTELMLKSFMIPKNLRPNKFTKNASEMNEAANNQTQKPKENHRFYKSTATNVVNIDAVKTEQPKNGIFDKLSLSMPKQKPVVRTFYLMGPKTQAAADAAKEKPILIKHSGNGTISNNILNVKNSTLFNKMRETVSGDFAATP